MAPNLYVVRVKRCSAAPYHVADEVHYLHGRANEPVVYRMLPLSGVMFLVGSV